MKILRDKTFNELQERLKALEAENQKLLSKSIEIDKKKVIVNPGASSREDEDSTSSISILQTSLKIIQPEYEFEVVPIIRKLVKINPDVNQAFNDLVRLANTGHKIIFDPSVGESQVEEMRTFLWESAKNWHTGSAGINGIINKMFRQVMVAGAIANEWIPNAKLDNLEEIRFLYPERVRWVLDRNNPRYQPYQKIKNKNLQQPNPARELKKLNPNQFKYYALNGDTNLPYGIPPYLASLDPIVTQKKMRANIDFIVDALGILGYVDARTAKPEPKAGETDDQYEVRLQLFLEKFKERVKKGHREGINVGFQDDHEFDFKQTAKDARGVKDLFDQNELMIASGLNYDAAFMGRPGSTETLVTILFTKMIAQLTNIQEIVKENLIFGYRLALTLGGFKFKSLDVVFNRSTISDDLKFQQAQEIKLRNLMALYDQGIISQDQFADLAGFIKPDQKEPRVSRDENVLEEAAQKTNREKKKDASDKKGRDKKNPQGTTRKPRAASASEGRVIDFPIAN